MSESGPFFPQKAAIDLTLGYGVDSFLDVFPLKDPWQDHSFLTLVDVVINHHDIYYPLPTRESLQAENIDLQNLPKSVATLYRAGVVRPFQKAVAEDKKGAFQALSVHYKQFIQFAAAHPGQLKGWSVFQDQLTPAHITRMPTIVSAWTEDFWDTQSEAARLANRIGIASESLERIFDVTFRGQQYDAILATDGVYYFPHRLRDLAYGGAIATEGIKIEAHFPWSWGRYLAAAIDRGWISREPERVLHIVASLRSKVGMEQATWYGLETASPAERKDILTTIAAESDLPAQLKDDVRKRIETVLKALAIPTAVAAFTVDHQFGAVTIALNSGALTVSAWRPTVPGHLTRYRRGILEWPGLLEKEAD